MLYKMFLFLICGSAMAQSPVSNPAVSVNTLLLYQHSNLNGENLSTERNGLGLQEAEITFLADVDPYTRLNLVLAIHPEYEADSANDRVSESWLIEPEEAYVDSLSFSGFSLRAGKFKGAFGKHNLLHTHAFAFTEAPLVNKGLLGDEGLNDFGLSGAVLFPTSWFSELTLQYLRGEGENEAFNSATPSDGVGLVHLKNLIDIADDTTLEWGGSGARGGNSVGGATSLIGVDLTYKWRPTLGGKYKSMVFAAEWIDRKVEQLGAAADHRQGWNVWSIYQWRQRWYAGLRWDSLETSSRWTSNVEFRASEFSSFRLEASHGHAIESSAIAFDKNENKITLQANFTIGAHPAHAY